MSLKNYSELIYKTILKSAWTYGIQLTETTSKSKLRIHPRFQNKVLRGFTNSHSMCSPQNPERSTNGFSIRIERHEKRITTTG